MDTVLEKEETMVEVNIPTLNNLLNENASFSTEFNHKGRMIGFKIVKYTPEMCKTILEHYNNRNRQLKRKNVDHILNEIGNGNWVFNGETFGFDENDDATNGQHRFTAISEGEESFVIPTFTNLDPDVFKTIDTGFNRTPADALSIEGVEDSVSVAPMVRFINDIVNNCFNNTARGRTHTLSNTDVLDYYNKLGEDKVRESINFYKETKTKSTLLPQKLINGFHYTFSCIDSEKGPEFMDKLITGTNITEGCPIKLLRDKLFVSKTTNNKKNKLNNSDKIKFITYTWGKFITGETMVRLNLPKNYEVTTDFSSVPTR